MMNGNGKKGSGLIPAVLIHVLQCFGSILMSSTVVYLIEQAVCREHYTLYDSGLVSFNGLVDEELCKIPQIESRVASIYGILVSLNYLPTLFLAGPYGNIGALLGKRTVIFLNLTSVVASEVYFVAICYFYRTFDIRWIYLFPLFELIGGGTVVLQSFLYTYISENTDSKKLSGFLYKISAASLLCTFLALTVSSFTLRRNVWLQCILGIGFEIILIPIALLLPDTHDKPLAEAEDTHTIPSVEPTTAVTFHADAEITETTGLLDSTAPTIVEEDEENTPQQPKIAEKPAVFKTLLHALSKSHTHTLSLFRSIFASPPFTRTTLLSYFFLTLGLNVSILFPQWASLTYNWIFADVASVSSFQMVVSGLVLVSLPSITSFLARRPSLASAAKVDLFVVKMSVLMNALGLVLIAFAPGRKTYIGAIGVYTLGSGVFDALRSFVTEKNGGEGLGELYLSIGMVETIGNVMASMGWGAALAVVLGKGYWAERTIFVAAAGVLMGVLVCVSVLGGMRTKVAEEEESERAEEGDSEVGCC